MEDDHLDKDYNSTYYNYHRNSLLLFGLCTAIWLFDGQIDEKWLFLKNFDPNLALFLPLAIYASAIYCGVMFYIEWKLQSHKNYRKVGNDLLVMSKISAEIHKSLELNSELYADIENSLGNLKKIFDNLDNLLFDNHAELRKNYYSKFLRKMDFFSEAAHNVYRPVSIIRDSAEISLITGNDRLNKQFDDLFRQVLALLEKSREIEIFQIENPEEDLTQTVIDVERQSDSINKLRTSFENFYNKFSERELDFGKFETSLSIISDTSREVKNIIILKVYIGGIGIIGAFATLATFSAAINYINFEKIYIILISNLLNIVR